MPTITPLSGHGGVRFRGSGVAAVGRGVTYIHKRLKRDRPDLLKRVVSGELSANAAAVEAGFRKRPSALEQMQKLWLRLSPAERRAHRVWISR